MSRLWSNATNLPPPDKAFSGETYEPKRDYARLTNQLGRVFDIMKDGQWRTLAQIGVGTWGYGASDTEAAISARLRDLRKQAHGGHTVERRRDGIGLYAYRLIVRKGQAA